VDRAHTDFDILTLLFQKPGQSGLEICPGRSVSTSFAHGDIWTPIDFPTATTIVCNIGDMLMHLSSDRFKSTFHRVRAPKMEGDKGEGARMSLAWFNQPCKGTRIVDRMGKYEELSAEEFILRGMRRNYEVNMHRGMEAQTQSDGDSTLNEGSDGHTTEDTISTADLTHHS
jgi:isopenicillin N synthase-like dioxygenase